MSAVRNPRADVLIALAAHWRSQGEFWDGTPEDARSQHCADELLKVLGLPPDGHTLADENAPTLLQAHGITNSFPPDRAAPMTALLSYEESLAGTLEDMRKLIAEFVAAGEMKKLELVVSDHVSNAFERGFELGRVSIVTRQKKSESP